MIRERAITVGDEFIIGGMSVFVYEIRGMDYGQKSVYKLKNHKACIYGPIKLICTEAFLNEIKVTK